jgi:hypothetical protein
MAIFSRMSRRKWRLARTVQVGRNLGELVEATDELGETD